MNRAKHNFIRKLNLYFNNLPFDISGRSLCVCLSGGADSVSLLLGLHDLSSELGICVSACHFNHMIRGEEADRDEEFCKSLCSNLGIKLYVGRDNVPEYSRVNKLSLEEAARECRYAFFGRLLAKDTVDYCVTAHNMNDDAETLLMNLLRGSGSNGASSIAAYSKDLLRPMLGIKREEIEQFLSDRNHTYITDSTNCDNSYTRNYIRNKIMPELIKVNPAAVEALSKFCNSSRVDREYFDKLVCENSDVALNTLHRAVRVRAIIDNFVKTLGFRPNSAIIEEIDNALLSEGRKIIPINDSYEAVVYKGKLSISNRTEGFARCFTPETINAGENILFDGNVTLYFSDNSENVSNVYKLVITDQISFDNIVGNVFARSRSEGDKIRINGMNKSLKKLFIEKKIPKEYRNIIPIIFDDEGIIYVPFVGVADRVRSTKCTTVRHITTVYNFIDKERWVSAYEK